MGREQIFLRMVISTLGNTLKAYPKAKANTNGKMAPATLGNLVRACAMAKVNGKRTKRQTATHTTAIFVKIKNKVMVSSDGNPATFLKEIINLTCGMDTVKCTGMMVVHIKVNGTKAINKDWA